MLFKNKRYIFVSDVDGVLTDGKFTYTKDGKQQKTFGAHDNDGLKILKEEYGVQFIFISADKRGFEITAKRIQDMNQKLIYISEQERQNLFEFIETSFLKNTDDQIMYIYMGDGLYDVKPLIDADIAFAPANALDIIKEDPGVYITKAKGGEGAFFQACMILKDILHKVNVSMECTLEENAEYQLECGFKDFIKTIVDSIECNLIENVTKQDLINIYDIITDAYINSKKIVGVGAGRVGYALRGFIMRLNHFGLNASFIGDTNVPKLDSNDILIVASTSGQTQTIKYYTQKAKQYDCIILSFTGKRRSSIKRLSSYNVSFDLNESNNYLMKTYGELTLNILFDAIIHALAFNSPLGKKIKIKNIQENHSFLE